MGANFQVTILSRTSSHEVDPRIKIQAVDYSSLDSLTAALTGQDAFVNVLNSGNIPVDIHLRLIEAAHKAKVYRFIPSEFGCDTLHPLTSKLAVFSDKVAVLKRLKEIADRDGSFTYTPIMTGIFLDWGLEKKLIVNLTGPSTVIYDGGDSRFSTTTLAGIGQAVVGTLQHLEETKNRPIYVSQADITQNELLAMSGKSDELERTHVQTADLEKQAYEALKKTPPDERTFDVNLVRRAIFDPNYGTLFARVDNELLGVPALAEPQILELLKRNI